MKCARVAAAASVVGLYEEGNKMSGDLIYINTGSSGIVHPEPQILLVRMIFLRNTFFCLLCATNVIRSEYFVTFVAKRCAFIGGLVIGCPFLDFLKVFSGQISFVASIFRM